MTSVITKISVPGVDTVSLTDEERQKLATQMISDRANGPVIRLRTPNVAGGEIVIDRRDNPTVTIEIEY